jgi:hypothetical protein
MADAIYYAMTTEGARLPIVDVTHPAFAVTVTDDELAALSESYVLGSRERGAMPAPVLEALQRSQLGRGLFAASGTYLSGIATYLLKLGPDNLPDGADEIDRRIAASFPARMTRLRLQDMTQLLTDGLTPTLCDAQARPLALVNLAAGVAADSWNALTMLRGAGVLEQRAVSIVAFDREEAGSAFARRAFETLCAQSAPLAGVNVAFRHEQYDWSDADQLRSRLQDMPRTALCAVSSEGGLFEYGSDDAVVANLQALHEGTARDTIVVGSATREGHPARASQVATGITTRLRTLDGFAAIVRRGGWHITRVIARPFSYHVSLHKA